MTAVLDEETALSCVFEKVPDKGIFRELMRTLADNRTVIRLCFHSASLSVEHACMIGTVLAKNKCIQVLNLNENYDLGDAGVHALAQGLVQNSSVLEVLLENGNVRANGARSLACCLTTNKTIIRLFLPYNSISDDGLGSNTSLKEGSLPPINSFAIGLGDCLQFNNTLQELNLDGNEVTAKGAEFLSTSLARNSSLRILSLARNNVEDKGASHFANALRENSSLMTLNLRNNKIGMPGAFNLLNTIISDNTTLKTLVLQDLVFRVNGEGTSILRGYVEKIDNLGRCNVEF
jgi:Ran GTPase-activating protein (RanGAP) involved in mRNA processing and transport